MSRRTTRSTSSSTTPSTFPNNRRDAEDIVKKATNAVTKINATDDQQTSIKHIGTDPEPKPDKPISTNTLINETGHNYVQDL